MTRVLLIFLRGAEVVNLCFVLRSFWFCQQANLVPSNITSTPDILYIFIPTMLIGKVDRTSDRNCVGCRELSARYLLCNGLAYVISLEADMLI